MEWFGWEGTPKTPPVPWAGHLPPSQGAPSLIPPWDTSRDGEQPVPEAIPALWDFHPFFNSTQTKPAQTSATSSISLIPAAPLSPRAVGSPPWQQRRWQSSPRCNPSHLWISSPSQPAGRSELQSRQETSQSLHLMLFHGQELNLFLAPSRFRAALRPHLVVGQPSS